MVDVILSREDFTNEAAKFMAARSKNDTADDWRDEAEQAVNDFMENEGCEWGDPAYTWDVDGAHVTAQDYLENQ